MTPINGVVTDGVNGISFADVIFTQQEDTTIQELYTTDLDGLLEAELPSGTYKMEIEYFTFEPYQQIIKVGQEAVQLDTVHLVLKVEEVEGVEIVGDKATVQFKLDKQIYNVTDDLSSKGGNALDVLENIPSVEVNVDGNVQVRGSANVRILVDGKPAGVMDADVLRMMQANAIEKIEVVTNPSAKYDAEGDGGVINIVLKKEKKKGVNGSVSIDAGYPILAGVGASLNRRSEKLNLFTNTNIGFRRIPMEGSYFERSTENGMSSVFESEQERLRGGLFVNTRTGVDFLIDDKNTVTFAGTYRYGYEDNTSDIVYTDFENGLSFNSSRFDNEIQVEHSFMLSLDYQKEYDKKDQKWTTSIQWQTDIDEEDSDIEALDNRESPSLTLQKATNTENEWSGLFQTDYELPFGGDKKVEFGAKLTTRKVENDFSVTEQNSAGIYELLDENFDDFLVYDELIGASYVQLGIDKEKWDFQIGLRGEYSDIGTELLISNQQNDRDYFNLFPSASANFTPRPEDQFQLSYSRRIARPWFRYLLPFSNFNDDRVQFRGNPSLDPVYTDAYQVGYLRYWKKFTFLWTGYYKNSTGTIERVFDFDETSDVTFLTPVNLGVEDRYGLEWSTKFKPYKWWNMNLNLDGSYFVNTGTFKDQDLKTEGEYLNAKLMSKWKLPKDFDMQHTFSYSSPRNTTQGKLEAIHSWDVAMSKDVLKKKGTLTFNVKDLLDQRKYVTVFEDASTYIERSNRWRVRRFSLNFTYKL